MKGLFQSHHIATISQIPIRLHPSVVIIPAYLGMRGYNDAGFAGVADALLLTLILLASIVAHEFGHIVPARIFGLKTDAIILTAVGGVALVNGKHGDTRAKHKLAIVAGGPVVSLVLALIGLLWISQTLNGAPIEDANSYAVTLFAVNTMLFLFNMLPVYPLDGGQILSALIELVGGKKYTSHFNAYSSLLGGVLLFTLAIYMGWLFMGLTSAILMLFGMFLLREIRRDKADTVVKRMSGVYAFAYDASGNLIGAARHWQHFDEEDAAHQAVELARLNALARERGGRLDYREFDLSS